MKNLTLLATLTMVGTIIGAGIFGVPYVMSRAGVPVGLVYIALLGGAMVLTHGMYAKIAIATPGKHRLVGYARRHLGPGAARVASLTNPLGHLGALLAYLILAGIFLETLLGGSALFWTVAFFLATSFLLGLPFRRAEFIEGVLTWALLALALAVVYFVLPHARAGNLVAVNLGEWFVPYGVILFSLSGASAIPDMVESLRKNVRRSLVSTTVGTTIAVLMTALFGVVVAGATGSGTTDDAISGLVPVVGRWIVLGGAALGLLAVLTSFITIASNLKEQFEYDFKFSPASSWAITALVPFLAFLLGARSFIGVLGFVGAVFGVVDGILIMLIARRIIRGWLRAATVPLILLFLVGIVAEMITLRA